jgi:hypothetical protein
MLKGKWSIEATQIQDHVAQQRDLTERKYKSKMSELIDEIDAKEKELIENMAQEKEQLKMAVN